ncbi:hypothetical protein P3T36_001111 [Kitasatospora sp. MAP12-15]|uniref:hypothetical protein n=1 Tax=unclassified Kitasatospora TaxID=2633591 RepID=UPI002476261F|nr:hypothetical protein [Kitasatospora sp. MAP12-44]MDH6114760.1 hypothetical protein [Kitasatospora sp. MAP12-44]
MTKRFLRAAILGRALVPGSLVVLAVPSLAYADTATVTVVSPGATMGPATPFTGVSSHADCARGLVSGGGVDQTTGDDRSGNGNHAMGIAPSADGVTELTGSPGVVGHDVTHWLAFGGSGSNSSLAFSTTPYAICLSSHQIRHTQVVMNKATGPSASLSAKLVVATCPKGTVLIGGGARTTPASVGSLKPVASFPTFDDAAHDFGQKAAADGETNPDSWTAVGGIGGGRDSGNTTYAYAICTGDHVKAEDLTTKVRFSEVSGPTTAGTLQTATADCASPAGDRRHGNGRDAWQLVSGGAAASGGKVTTTDFTKAGSGGTHLTGSFPSDSAGTPVADGTPAPASWTATVHAGGSPSPNTYTDVWALCLNTRHGNGEQ